jgi:hypothetical protein
MKLLLDECIDQRFATEIVGYEVRTVPEMGWANIKNGQLLTLAQAEFDAFITVDRNLPYQQNLPKYNIAVVVLRAKSNRSCRFCWAFCLTRQLVKQPWLAFNFFCRVLAISTTKRVLTLSTRFAFIYSNDIKTHSSAARNRSAAGLLLW